MSQPKRMRHMNRRQFAFVALLSVLSVNLAADDLFPDKNLEAAIRKYVFEKRDNTEPLTEDDVKNISTIKARGKGDKKIKDLRGLEKCRSLALLHLPDHEITDLTPIKELKRIQSLDLANNKIKDIAPLAGLTALQYAKLSGNEISDLAPLARLENMRSLYLEDNKVADVTPIAGLTKLWSLYLDGNQVKDISTIAKLKWLKNLGLRNNQITDIRPLAELTELTWLFLEKNKITEISTLVEMAKKDFEGDKRFAPFWRIYLADNPLSDAAKGEQIAALKQMGARVVVEQGK